MPTETTDYADRGDGLAVRNDGVEAAGQHRLSELPSHADEAAESAPAKQQSESAGHRKLKRQNTPALRTKAAKQHQQPELPRTCR